MRAISAGWITRIVSCGVCRVGLSPAQSQAAGIPAPWNVMWSLNPCEIVACVSAGTWSRRAIVNIVATMDPVVPMIWTSGPAPTMSMLIIPLSERRSAGASKSR